MSCVKRILAVFLTVCMLLSCVTALAEEAEPAVSDTLVVGSTTAMSGNFFSEMFGNNTSDIDVRTLLHGYNLMHWQGELGSYGVNRSVVSGMMAMDDDEGNRTYTVTLYSDLKYSDGTSITAADYAFAMLLTMAPEMKEIGAQTVLSDYIVGAEAYWAGETDALAGMRIFNDTTLAIKTKAEYTPYFYELGLLDYTPYPIHVIAPGCEVVDEGRGATIRNIDETIEEPIFTTELLQETILNPETGYLSHPSVVSGAYMLDSYDAQTHTAAFTANPYFKGDFDGYKPFIEHLVYKPVSPDTMIDELANGEVDLLNKCTAAKVIDDGMALLGSENGHFSMKSYPRTGYSFVSFSCERPAVDSAAVRQAIAHCLDKEALVTVYVRGYGVSVDAYYGIGQWMYPLLMGNQEPPVVEPPSDATEEERQAYADALDAWNSLNMDGVKVYDFDVSKAIRLLERDGWVLNQNGEAYDAEADAFRCKDVGGQLLALDLKMIYPEGNSVGNLFQETFLKHLAQAGIRVTVEAVQMDELLQIYYRQVDRDCDMIYLATNFATVFDPSYTFHPGDAYQGSANVTGIRDDELYIRTVDMRLTEPGDVLNYLRKWIKFQERWSEVLPSIPVYSNVYFDFHIDTLQDYQISSGMTWADAIVRAYIGEPAAVEEEDDEMIIE